MVNITPAEAVSAVRKNLDEQQINASAMYVSGSPDTSDEDTLDELIRRTLPEAVNAVHRNADATLLDGIDGKSGMAGTAVSDNVLSFRFNPVILRLVAFQTSDSPVVLGDWVPEYSPEGRMQNDPYVRGTWDEPVLVKEQGVQQFRYYSLREGTDAAGAVKRFDYIPEHIYSPATASYVVAALLREPALLHLTGMVLSIYGESDKAKYFFDKASAL